MSEWVVIQQTSPIIIAILAVFMLNEKFEKKHFLIILTSMTGILLIAKPPFLFPTVDTTGSVGQHLYGVLFSFLGAFFGSIVQLLVKKLGKNSTIVVVFYFGLMGTIIFPVAMYVEGFASIDNKIIIIGLVLIGVLSFFGQSLKNRAFLYGKAARISMIGYSSIVFSFLLDIFYFKLYPDTYSIVGSGLIVSGLLVMVLQKNSKEKSLEDEKEDSTEAISSPEQEEEPAPEAAGSVRIDIILPINESMSSSLNGNLVDNKESLLEAEA